MTQLEDIERQIRYEHLDGEWRIAIAEDHLIVGVERWNDTNMRGRRVESVMEFVLRVDESVWASLWCSAQALACKKTIK